MKLHCAHCSSCSWCTWLFGRLIVTKPKVDAARNTRHLLYFKQLVGRGCQLTRHESGQSRWGTLALHTHWGIGHHFCRPHQVSFDDPTPFRSMVPKYEVWNKVKCFWGGSFKEIPVALLEWPIILTMLQTSQGRQCLWPIQKATGCCASLAEQKPDIFNCHTESHIILLYCLVCIVALGGPSLVVGLFVTMNMLHFATILHQLIS